MSKLLELAERAENLLCEWAAIAAFNQAVHDTIDGIKTVIPPDYCRSLDAAMTLVPEGLTAAAVKFSNGTGRANIHNGIDVRAATPALALCAASLRARDAALRALSNRAVK